MFSDLEVVFRLMGRGGNRPDQTLKDLSLAYDEFFRPEPGL